MNAGGGDTPRVVVLVLNWNGREDTLGCLESLKAVDYPNWEVLVVDNGSEDGSVDAIRKNYPEAIVIETGRNLGFAGGNNVGIEAALKRSADFVLLLNNDTTVAPDLLQAFVQAAERHPEAGIFGAKIYYFSDPKRLWFAGARWNAKGLDLEIIGQGTVDDDDAGYGQALETQYACGCAMFFRASLAETVGLLDDRFFILYEEIEWCFRARKAGFQCLFVPKAKVWHRVSTTFGGGRSLVFEYFLLRNRLLWAERHLPLQRRIRFWLDTLEMLWPLWKAPGTLWKLLRGRCGVKQAYWEIREWARDWLDDLRDPDLRTVKKVQWCAVFHYLIRRFGNCPPWVRAAAAKARVVKST